MNNQKKVTPEIVKMFALITLFALTLSITGCAASLLSTQTLTPTHLAATPENLQFIDFQFTPLDPNDSRLKNAISQDQAVLAALKFALEGKTATSVTTQVGFSDGGMVIELSKDRLVWLVTFHGVDSVSSGPPGSTHRVSHELTVAVDAYQGNAIVSMTLGIVTPQSMVPTSTPSQPSPTLSPTWGPQGHIYPPTIQAYVDEVHLDQTTRIEFTHPVSHEQVVITTQSMIQAIVELLDSKMDHCAGTPESTDYALLIIMNVPAEGSENIISVNYRPATSDVLLDNIPTGSWPVKIQNSYSVCPGFGKSLFELLDIDASMIPAKKPTALSQPQSLRITNQSAYTIHDLFVRFPEEWVEFGDVLPGETTDYQIVSRGVYRYSGYKIELNGQVYEQVPYDFLGESPMNGNAFTYVLNLDPIRKTDPVQKTGIEVIQLVQVKKDQ